jgi:hypothetical protein
MAKKDFFDFYDDFKEGSRAFAKATVESAGKWYTTETAAMGTPTYVVSSSGLTTSMEATSEAQNLCHSHHDVLTFDPTKITEVEFVAKCGATAWVTGTSVAFGLGTARNDTVTSMSKYILFRVIAATSTTLVVISASDGTTTYTTVATGKTLINALKRFQISFANGVNDIRFFIDGQPVATSTTFAMAALTATTPLQPIIQLQKTASTNADALTIKEARIRGRSGLAL